MDSITEFLNRQVFGRIEREAKIREIRARFAFCLSSEVPDFWFLSLTRFIYSNPWNYWDSRLVDICLQILESSDKSNLAISDRALQIGAGFENLFRISPILKFEEKLEFTKADDVIKLATEFHPEYLRLAEHVFSNLFILYWAVLKKKSIYGKYELKSAIAAVKSRNRDEILAGFDEQIRNALAHGEVTFTAYSIKYGEREETTISEFLNKFDTLWRTCNSLAIGLLVFLAKQRANNDFPKSLKLPLGVIQILSSTAVETAGIEVKGLFESESVSIGKQLHISIYTQTLERKLLMFQCARLAMYLIQNGAREFSRFVFNIDHGKTVASLLMIDSQKLADLTDADSPVDLLPNTFIQPILLWHNESRMRLRLRTYREILRSSFFNQWDLLQGNWRSQGFRLGSGLYNLKCVRNKSTGGVIRLEAYVTLRYPDQFEDIETLRHIVDLITRRLSRKWYKHPRNVIESKWYPLSRPKYIWVNLFKTDGTLRWLETYGTVTGCLVAVAEKIKGDYQPIKIKNSDEIWKGIRFKYMNG